MAGDIERIEVLRGPQSGLYGSDALGGVISITTKQGSGPPKVTASVEGGSFGTTREQVGLSGSQGDFNYAFNIQHLPRGRLANMDLTESGSGRRLTPVCRCLSATARAKTLSWTSPTAKVCSPMAAVG